MFKNVWVVTLLTVIATILATWANVCVDQVGMLYLGNAAVDQLANSDSGYFSFMYAKWAYQAAHVFIDVFWIAFVVAIWVGYNTSKKTVGAIGAALGALVLGSIAFAPTPSYAYYDKSDYSEYIEIRPNETAFMLPMVGANKDKQGQFGSVEYLNSNKIAAKRVQIPHVKAAGTGALTDFYVPGSKLYILDRTPVSREWVATAARGTSKDNQEFYFESADSINIHTGIVVTAFVKEEDAAKFWYSYGSRRISDADYQKPEVQFASVVYGRSLADVVDSDVRRQVQASLSKEFGKRPLDQAIMDKAAIIEAVRNDVVAQFSPYGVTIQTLGYADALSFDPEIQKVINDNYIAQKKLKNKDAYTVSLDIEKQEAEIYATRTRANSLAKWNGTLPNWMLSGDFSKWFDGIFGGKK